MNSLLSHRSKTIDLSSPLSTGRRFYLDWSGNPFACDCDVITFIAWLEIEGKWLINVSGYHDVICFNARAADGVSSLEVYVKKDINRRNLAKILSICNETRIDVTTTSNDISNNAIPNTVVVPSLSKSINTSLMVRTLSATTGKEIYPHLPYIIAASVLFDVTVYVVMFVLIKKKVFICRRNTSVSPTSES